MAMSRQSIFKQLELLDNSFKDIPTDWLLERNRGLISKGIFLCASGNITASLVLTATGGNTEELAAMLMTLGLAELAFVHYSDMFGKESWFRAAVLVYAVCSSATYYYPLFSFDLQQRHRLLGLVHMSLAFGPHSLNLSAKACAWFVLWYAAHLVLSGILLGRIRGDWLPVRYYFLALIPYCFAVGLAVNKNAFLRELYDVQRQLKAEKEASDTARQQLQAEKEASESLLNMVCDASLWISAKGVVVKSSCRFDSISGQNMVGQSFFDNIPERERSRVARFVQGEALGASNNVRLLSTSFSSSASLADVDLFIVDRASGVDSSLSAKHLIGLRLHSPAQLDTCSVASEFRQDIVSTFSTSGGFSSEGAEAMAGALAAINRYSCSDSESLPSWSSSLPARPNGGMKANTAPQRTPQFHGKFETSNHATWEQSMMLLTDMIEAFHFEISSCCAWHTYVKILGEMIEELECQKCCSNESLSATWQCRSCLALGNDTMSSCLLCGLDKPALKDRSLELR